MNKQPGTFNGRRFIVYGNSTNWAYGMGAFVVDNYTPGIDVIWHGGDVDGYAGSLAIMPNEDIAFTYLTNVGKGDGFEEFQKDLMSRTVELCNKRVR